ncbi:hypothetical protein [Bifidobacterium mongoliense]|uniref:hypothetical protein n=1 Tax=Bifidobacterium mongoliense TaxID=518643 RepID=UPI0030EF9F32
MNDECKGILSIVLTAVLALVIIVSLLWWVSGLAHGVFALGPFTSLMIGITVAGVCSGERRP